VKPDAAATFDSAVDVVVVASASLAFEADGTDCTLRAESAEAVWTSALSTTDDETIRSLAASVSSALDATADVLGAPRLAGSLDSSNERDALRTSVCIAGTRCVRSSVPSRAGSVVSLIVEDVLSPSDE
jgi:hypothetical protein